jgi:hypothetical protein
LESPLLALSNGWQPQLFGSTIMYKKLVQDVVDPISQEWQGAEDLSIYQTGADATQVMTSLAQLAARCRSSAQVRDSGGMQTREQLVTLSGLGNQEFDIQVRSTAPDTLEVADDWIIIRDGRCLLDVYEQTAPSTLWKYLQPAAQTAWRAFQNGS